MKHKTQNTIKFFFNQAFHASCFKFQERGFTLIESIVAIGVFTVGISAAMFVINQSITANTRTKNKIIASYLAQEGLEVVRNIRDRNWMAARGWTDKIDSLGNACVQWDTDYINIDNHKTCLPLGSYLSFSGAHYEPTTALTQFKRTINTQYTPAGIDPERLKVTSAVTCGANCSVSLDEYLYNWK